MPVTIEYKGYVVSANAEHWAEEVWAGSYFIKVGSTNETVWELQDAVVGKTFDKACSSALELGRRYIDRILLGKTAD